MSTALIQPGQMVDRDPSHEVRVKIGLSNNRLISMREEHSWSQKQAAEKMGLRYAVLNGFECMRAFPFKEKEQRWTESAIHCAEFYGVLPEWLFPEALKLIRTRDITISGNVSQLPSYLQVPESSEILALPASAMYEQKEAMQLVANALGSLTPREEEVLRMRFFEELSLQEVALKFDVTRERIRQIEAKAIRKLRQPKRNMELRELING